MTFKGDVYRYAKRYFFKNTTFVDRTIVTFESVCEEIALEVRARTEGEIDNSLGEIKVQSDAFRRERELIRSRFRFDEADLRLFSFCERLMVFIDHRKEVMMKGFFYIFTILHSLCDDAGIDFDTLQSFTSDEIESWLKGEFELSKDIIKERSGGVLVLYQGRISALFTGEKARVVFQKYLDSPKDSTDGPLIGTVASHGKEKVYTGRVKIVKDPARDGFAVGEILVASMTRIEFVPLMKRALVIITDEGGIACHAAIVSRELGVPCIIGTKIATQVLHDGDLVEVDADHGVVRIVEKE